MTKQAYTVVALVNNQVSVLNRITGAYLKRHINIELLNVSESHTPGVSTVIITAIITEEMAKMIVNQLSSNIDIVFVNYYLDQEIIHKEVFPKTNFLQTTY
ncbi:MAG: hypothetical protein WCR61_06890 [Bacteroidales bacterium]|nr:hypothetical protein [Bacteroidales bacterium]MDD4657079.1 hypothetical protein [Bacteroidales bacterium]